MENNQYRVTFGNRKNKALMAWLNVWLGGEMCQQK